jgi:Flp pilus assembly protein TadD
MVGVAAALVAYVVQQQFLFQLFDVDAVAWLLVGAVTGLGLTVTASVGPPLVPSTRVRPAMARLAGAALVLALAAVAISAASGVEGDREARTSVDGRAADPSAAVTAAADSLDARPQTLPALVLADAALADGSTDALEAARERLGSVRSDTFDDGRLTLARARLARADGRTDLIEDSVTEVTQLLSVDPSRSDGWMELGELQAHLDLNGDAQRSFERTVALAPTRTDAWIGLAIAADRAGDDVSARGAMEHVDPSALDADGLALRSRLFVERPATPSAR